MIDNLKPCPFCGGEAEKQWGLMSIYWVECTDCGAEGSQHPSLEEAIGAWNTRNPMDRIVEQLEKIAPQPKTECYAHVDEYLCALEMYEKCIEIVKGGGSDVVGE